MLLDIIMASNVLGRHVLGTFHARPHECIGAYKGGSDARHLWCYRLSFRKVHLVRARDHREKMELKERLLDVYVLKTLLVLPSP